VGAWHYSPGSRYEIIAVEPVGVDMSKVAATVSVIDKVCDDLWMPKRRDLHLRRSRDFHPSRSRASRCWR
jgi:hypothetical protein